MKRSVPAEELMHSIGLQKRGRESIGTGPSVGCIKKYQEVYLWRKKYRSGKKAILPLKKQRHTFTTRLCEAGVNVKVILDTLGHADISMTLNIYAAVTILPPFSKRQTLHLRHE